jgi:hypothetical protein
VEQQKMTNSVKGHHEPRLNAKHAERRERRHGSAPEPPSNSIMFDSKKPFLLHFSYN